MPLPTDQLLTPAAYRQFFDHPKSEFLKGIRPTLEDVLARNLAGDRNWQLDGWKSAIASLPEHSAPEPAFREGVVCLDGNSSRDSSASKQAVDLRRNSPAPDAAGRTDGYSNSRPDADTGPREIDAIRTAGADSPADLPAVSPGSTTGPADVTAAPRKNLRKLMPWRKGPWQIFGVDIDTEWRSDWKWDRVLPVIDNLKGRRVLDIGCGNGYHLWRMYREGADAAVGIEPHLLNVAQFAVMQRSFPGFPVTVLPMPLEEYPVNTRIYDTVFSMGVLYHRKSPVDHLLHCKSCLREGGQFVLETLVVEGDVDTLLVPEDRYAKMRNVWTIPSPAHLERLLRRVGFRNIRLMDVNQTSLEEQRATEWMEFESLADFLDPTDRDRTVEGYPAPRRALFVCEAP